MGEIENEISTLRELSLPHVSMETEKQFLELIRTGNTTELAKLWTVIPSEDMPILSKRSQLRNIKNIAICMTSYNFV